jgi:hypothetical protein
VSGQLEGLLASRHEVDSYQLELVGSCHSDRKVSYVNWIERSAEYTDSHRNPEDVVSVTHGSARASMSG